MAGGKRRANVEFTKKVGYFEARVLMINPSREELSELMGFEMERDPEYLKEDDEGNKKVTLNIWLEDQKTKQKFNLKITITNKTRVDKNDVKTQYVNRRGWTTWSEDEDSLPDWFTEKGNGRWRKALAGEELFSNFMSSWLHDLDFKNDEDADIFVDLTKLFRGNYKELNDLIKNYKDNTFVCLATIVTKEKEDTGEVVEYQNIYNKAFLPGNFFKYLKMGGGSPYAKKQIEKFKETITDGEYGCDDFYQMVELKDYNSAENPAAGDSTKVSSGDNSDEEFDENALEEAANGEEDEDMAY